MRKTPKSVIRDLVADRGTIATRDVTAETGLTRQAVNYHLAQMLSSGELIRIGAGRGTRYRLEALMVREYPLAGLEEDRVWRVVEAAIDGTQLRPNVRSILGYAFTEMLNNAIDHSQGIVARVTVLRNTSLTLQVEDDGLGVFRTVREKLGLLDNLSAIQELAKGKQTTDPARHSGQGIFFTSKAVDVFQLESNETKWIVDNFRSDQAVGSSPVRSGTRVRFSLHVDSGRLLREVFDSFTDPETLEFSKTTPVVRLFQAGDMFVSRSEAKRLSANLEKFDEVTLDFSGVNEVGQGFVDELFRVWARNHPATKLKTINANPGVEAMIRRARGS